MRVLAISGSLRSGSHNTRLLRQAGELLPGGVELEFYDALRAVEPYDQDADGDWTPHGARRFREAIARADAVLIATPEYNGTVPGQLKNALDWASRPRPGAALEGKPAAVIGASTGQFGGVWAQADLRKALGLSGARVVDGELPVARAHQAFDEHGRLLDSGLRERLAELLEELLAQAEAAGEEELAAA